MDCDEFLNKEIEKYDGDINKVFLKLQEEFFIKYNKSVKLNNFSKSQLKTLSFYKKRNNALLDILAELEANNTDQSVINTPIPSAIDDESFTSRLHNIISLNENLQNIDKLTPEKIKHLKMDLLLDESISELEIDDLINVQKNPEDIEFWLRRNQPNLVLSRFRPVEHKNNKLVKNDSNLDNLNNSLNNHVNNIGSKKRKKV